MRPGESRGQNKQPRNDSPRLSHLKQNWHSRFSSKNQFSYHDTISILLTICLMLRPGAPSAVPEAAQVRCSSRLAGAARSRAAHFAAAAALGPHPEGPRRLSTRRSALQSELKLG